MEGTNGITHYIPLSVDSKAAEAYRSMAWYKAADSGKYGLVVCSRNRKDFEYDMVIMEMRPKEDASLFLCFSLYFITCND